ncbi:MAG: right-handed parallel beta-helix repeat-containing protein, partial [Phaeodactylibacter sp.]|nr:right-handed parallel beta-helix repeat-containing protein [Phaeodactylibacter sp.]
MRRPTLLLALTALCLAMAFNTLHATVRYVKPVASGAGDGSSWDDASAGLQAMINASTPGDQIWVAAGMYTPPTTNDRNVHFSLVDGVELYGGFAGTESSLSERDIAANPTLISGDIGAVGNFNDNSFILIDATGADNCIVDGFIIRDSRNEFGDACMRLNTSSVIFRNCVFTNNDGFNYNVLRSTNSTVAFINCEVTGNLGGGTNIINTDGDFTMVNSAIYDTNGKGINNTGSGNCTLTNCLFSGITASIHNGGALGQSSTGNMDLINCTFTNISAFLNPAILVGSGYSATAVNCIFWDNQGGSGIGADGTFTVTHSIVQGGYAGMGNLSEGPLFTDAANGDFQLQECSPAIDAGDNSANSTTEDLAGSPRVVDAAGAAVIDMGAYEYQSTVDICNCYPDNIIYVNDDALGAGNGKNWDDAFTDLQDALALAGACPNVTEIWVAEGTYYPTATGDRNAKFQIPSGLKLYGGFAGGETAVAQRNIGANPAILSGEIGDPATNLDNSYNIVVMTNVMTGTRLDGFTVSDSHNTFTGGAVNVSGSATVANCILERNTAYVGGGITFNGALLTVDNCTFRNNLGFAGGGGIAAGSGAVHVSYSVFDSNTGNDSGGVFFSQGSPDANFDNCVFYNNKALNFQGGVIYNQAGTLVMTNCTVAKNSNRADIAAPPANITITNTILWGNNSGPFQSYPSSGVSYSITNTWYVAPGTGNLNIDPLFVDINDGDGPDNIWGTPDDGLYIQPCSPAVDGGNTPASTIDFLGNPRVDAPAIGVSPVDIGAYEQQEAAYPVVITDISIDNVSVLNDNGTICSADDTFTGDVAVTFFNVSSTGALSLAGPEILSTLAPVPIANTTTPSTHVFTGVSFAAFGETTLTAAFSDMPCTYSETITGTPSAGIGNIECTDCGTPWYDDGGPTGNYAQDVSKIFCPPATDYKAQLDFTFLDLEYESLYIYDGTDYSADFLAEVDGSSPVPRTVTATASNPSGCLLVDFYYYGGTGAGWEATFNCVRIFDISANNIAGCDGNGTTCATDDTYTADITVSFASKPAAGTLSLSGADIVGASPTPVDVNSLTGNTHTFTGVALRADRAPIELSAVFSDEPAAVFNGVAGTAPAQCSSSELLNLLGIYLYDPEIYYVDVTDWSTQSARTLTMTGYDVEGGNSIALNPTNGLYYAILQVDNDDPRLATVDIATGICTDIGSLGNQYRFSSITFAPDGTLYGCTGNNGSSPGSLFTIDPATGVATLRQALQSGGGHVLAFNPDDGFLYHFTNGYIEKVDPATYARSAITLSGDIYANPLGAVYKGNGSFYMGDWNSRMYSVSASGVSTLLSEDQEDYFRGYALLYNAPPACGVSDISLSDITGCNGNGTTDETDDYFTADVAVTFAYAPAGGALTLKRGADVLATTMADLACTTTHTFSGVQMAADGNDIVLTAEFSNDCSYTSNLGAAPASCSCPAGNRLYVTTTGAGDGSSWASPLGGLQDALALAAACPDIDEIWVATGVYKPSEYPSFCGGCTDPRDVAFELVEGVSIYGGFAGTETALSERIIESNPAILSGDIGTANDNSDNAYHVLVALNITNATALDGFIIRDGTALGSNISPAGFGITRTQAGALALQGSYPVISNCRFINNSASFSGGAIYTNGNVSGPLAFTDCTFEENDCSGTSAADAGAIDLNSNFSAGVTFSRCLFKGNTAADDGGALAIDQPEVHLNECIFEGNIAIGGDGGAILNEVDEYLYITNCLFTGNQSGGGDGGGAIFGSDDDDDIYMVITNSTFYGNHTEGEGGAIYVYGYAYVTTVNSIFWGNTAANGSPDQSQMYADNPEDSPTSYSIFQFGFPDGFD